ncbi:Transmembrane 7 superfamily member 3 [Operophtera brumata]|uniref:Transmembrane 7 superfamily member 3 n=1 Tax=Operophtera brumata TaxID=104452 RepID=A0A0L7LCK5_OPEBR|nr:Transmembrane 7 superfamily member 3 [Operophtera brumata]
MTLVTIFLLSINIIANLICCAVIGAFATILPIDYYSGSQMKYILINIERRATVTDFYKAMQMPTFQWKDWLLAFLWLGLSVTGFIFQYHQNKGRPPFPPPPRSVRAVPELPALVAGSSGGRRSLINEVGGVRSLPHIPSERTPLLT